MEGILSIPLRRWFISWEVQPGNLNTPHVTGAECRGPSRQHVKNSTKASYHHHHTYSILCVFMSGRLTSSPSYCQFDQQHQLVFSSILDQISFFSIVALYDLWLDYIISSIEMDRNQIKRLACIRWWKVYTYLSPSRLVFIKLNMTWKLASWKSDG